MTNAGDGGGVFLSSLIAFQFLSYSGTHLDALVILDLQDALVEVWMQEVTLADWLHPYL